MMHNSLHKKQAGSPLIHAIHLQEINSKLAILVNKICQRIVTLINHASELQVWQTRDRSGHSWWNGYDPSTGKSIRLDSEAEMRMWIEERYYQD